MMAGVSCIGLSMYAFDTGLMTDPIIWMSLLGLGAYITYIPVGCVLFERLIASSEFRSNAGFLIYVADAIGYIGSIGVLLYKELFFKDMSVLGFFTQFSYLMAGVGLVSLIYAYFYFAGVSRAKAA